MKNIIYLIVIIGWSILQARRKAMRAQKAKDAAMQAASPTMLPPPPARATQRQAAVLGPVSAEENQPIRADRSIPLPSAPLNVYQDRSQPIQDRFQPSVEEPPEAIRPLMESAKRRKKKKQADDEVVEEIVIPASSIGMQNYEKVDAVQTRFALDRDSLRKYVVIREGAWPAAFPQAAFARSKESRITMDLERTPLEFGSAPSVRDVLELKSFDITTFLSVLLLVIAGFFAIYSATYAANMNNRFGQQLLFAAGGIAGMIVMAMIPVRWFQAIAYPLYAISLGLLVFVALRGKLVYGHRSWIAIGSFQFQPSEIAKLATIFTVGAFLNKGRDLSKFTNVLIVCALVFIPTALILKEPDPGTAVIFVGLLIITLLWSGVDLFLLAAVVIPALVAVLSLFGQTPTVIAVLAGGMILFFIFRRNLIVTVLAFGIVIAIAFSTNFIYEHLHQYQRNRVQVLLNPELDPLGAGYNVIQTRMAIGSGGILGKGYLKGTQTQLRYVPKQWTDFIISVPSEEFGFVGAVVILLLYLFVIFRGVAIASSVRSIFSSVVAIGIAGIWFLHVTVNIGMALGLMPVIGIPLPFMSYGGSALLTNLLMAGILMNLYRNRKVLF